MKLDLIICGVGGQGNLLASVAVANYAMQKGFNVIGSETIGAAQRGGSVVSHLRISDNEMYSSTIPAGSADILLGFEPVEAMRHMERLGSSGQYIINIEPVPTVNCNMGLDKYPPLEEIIGQLNRVSNRGYRVNASEKARELGDIIMTNIVLLGILCRVSDFFDRDEFVKVLEEIVPAKARDVNLEAFKAGYNMVDKEV